MKNYKMLVVLALMILSFVIFSGTAYGESMWLWIILYWMMVFVKWLFDYVDHS